MNLSLVTCSKVCKFFLKIQKKNSSDFHYTSLICSKLPVYILSFRSIWMGKKISCYEWNSKYFICANTSYQRASSII